ncbi:DUF5799 family protein [Natronomonas sp. EA1]|uniref:DUF5799 family protein n=1 Tax=Natronomonas sp. EA1 TaxID=3421655 RepID=UPI003EBFDE15
MSNWQDRIVGARMAVDNEFAPEITNSQFSRQEWGLIMTAVEFDIENADTDDARLVADTSNLEDIMPEVERVAKMQQQAGMGGEKEKSGLLGSVKSALGLGSSKSKKETDAEKVAAAEALAQNYATALQEHLEKNGSWESVRDAYGSS